MHIFTLQVKAKIVLDTTMKQWFSEMTVVDEIDSTLHLALSQLWADEGVQECYKRRNEFHLEDCAKQYDKASLRRLF